MTYKFPKLTDLQLVFRGFADILKLLSAPIT